MKKLLFAVLTIILIVSSIAAAVSIPLTNPQIAAAEEPESGVIVLDQNTEVEYTGNSSIDEETGETVYEYEAHIALAPIYLSDLETKIDPQFYWNAENNEWYAGANLFDLTVTGSSVTYSNNGGESQWDPEVVVGDVSYRSISSTPQLIESDPINANYHNNIIEWDYGICVRQLRLIEGMFFENFIFNEDPGSDVEIISNLYCSSNWDENRLPYAYDADGKILDVILEDGRKIVLADEFDGASYPVTIDPPSTVPADASDGFMQYWMTLYQHVWESNVGGPYTSYPFYDIGQDYRSNPQDYFIDRGFVFFDTSGIPNDATITGATLNLYGYAAWLYNNFYLTVQTGTSTAYPGMPLQYSDFWKDHYTGNGGSLYTGSFITGGYNSISLNPTGMSWIDKTGWTKLVLRSSNDINGVAPTTTELLEVGSYELGNGMWPTLYVTYEGGNPDPTPSISYSPSSLSFSTTAGSNPSEQTLYIMNSGSGTLSWTVSDNAAWLSLNPTSGSSTGGWDGVTASVNVAGLSAGSYSATITISASGATNTPQTIPVYLSITSPTPSISYSPSSLSFSTTAGSNPSAQTLYIRNSGDGTLSWTVNDNAAWLSLNPTSGSSTGEWDDITASVNVAGLSAGYYSAAVTISASGASNTPQTMPVYLSIANPTTPTPTPITYTLTTSVVGSGSINPAPGTHTYPSGTSVTLTATPADGWTFSGWSGSLSGTDNPTSINMNGNKAITATFTCEPWSFAIITDLHVGEGAPNNDFGASDWNDNGNYSNSMSNSGLLYLRTSVAFLNDKIRRGGNPDNIKFVAVLGDFTDSAELSEMQAAIDELNELAVPWLPIIGNHDIWPYTNSSVDYEAPGPVSGGPGTDYYFYNKFYNQYNEFCSELGISLDSQAPPVQNPDAGEQISYLQNFAFDYGGYHFIGLDFNDRNRAPLFKPGVGPRGNLYNFEGGTYQWLADHLSNYTNNIENQAKGKHIILLSHHSFIDALERDDLNETMGPCETISEYFGFSQADVYNNIVPLLYTYKDYLVGQFAGHDHPGDAEWNGQCRTNRNPITKQLSKWDFYMTCSPYQCSSFFLKIADIMPCVTIPGNLNIPWVTIANVNPSTKEVDYDETLFSSVIYRANCPVDLVVTDPEGLAISKDTNQIPGAMYITKEYDENGNSSPCDLIWIPDRKLGNYSVQVVPEQSANASDTFTLTASPLEDKWGYTSIVLAQNVTMSNIPAEPYTFEVKQRIATNISYTGALGGYNFDMVNLTATFSTENGSRLSGKTINFLIGNQTASAVTNSNGIATAYLTLNQTPCQYYYIEYGFDGDTDYLPFYDSQPFEIMNKLPVADIGGPYASDEGSAITFNASNSYDQDGSIVSYEWDLNGDSNFSDAQGAMVQHTWPDDYTGNIRLRVTDDCGANSTATTTVTVSNVAPTVNAGPDIASVLVGSTVSFNGSFTDPGILDTHTIKWNFGDGTPTVNGTLTPSHAYTSGGNYTVTLKVTDDDGGIGTDTLTVHVNYPPVANPGRPYTGNEGSTITFNGSGCYDPDGAIATYSWNFGDSTPLVTGTATPTHAYGDNGIYTVTLTVTDNNGAISTAATTATIANVAPAVNAGPDMEDVPIGSTINFNGSFTDPGWLDTHTIAWNFGDGTPAVTGTLTPSHAYSVGGDYTVTLNVTDDDGGLGTDTAAINVNVPPVADPGGPYTGNEGSPITFNGSGSYDTDGTIVSYEWDLDNDGEYDDATGVMPSFTWNDDYSGIIGLRVTDDTGEAVTAETTVTVNNVAPTTDAGANVDYVLAGSPVDFNGSFTDPGTGDTHTIEWNFGDGTPIVTGTLTPSHTYASGGDYTVTLTVTDDDGGIGSDTLTVHVNDAPIANPAGPYTGNEGSAITFNGSASYDPDGSIVSYEWDLDCDGDFSDAQGAIVQNTWPDDYACNVSLKVTDDEGATGFATTTVTVNNVAPTVEAGPDQSAECCVTNVAFNGSFTDPGILDTPTITWNFGDGGTASATLSPTHTYCDPGVYNVTLTVTDDDGGVGSDTLTVHVTDTIQPLVNISSPMNGQTYINTQGLIAINYTASDICDQTPDIVITLDGVAIDDENVDPSVLALGGHTLTVTVTDSSGNVATASVTFTIKPQLSAWGRTWGFLEWYTCGHPTNPADFFGGYSYPLVTANDSIYSWINADDSNYWRHTGYKSLPTPWEQSQLFIYKITQDRAGVSNLSISWTGHGGNGDLIYHTKLKIWNYRTGSWNTLVDVTSPGSKTFQTYDRGITTNATDFIEAGTGNVSILVSSDDDGRGLTEDTEGIFTDHIALNVNAANTPASPSTTTYNFASGGGTNKWCWEGHVHMIDWNGGHPTTPADFANSYGYIQGNSSAYSALAASDDSRWKSSISHDLGCCAFDRNCELFKFNIAENSSSITNIGLKWEGHGTTGETIYYTTLKIWNPSSGTWQQLHNQQNTTSDVTWIDNIAGNCSNYIDATGNLYVLACAQRSGLSGNCGIWTDYIEVIITHN